MPPVTLISPEGQPYTADESEVPGLVESGFTVENTAAGTTRVLGEEQERAYGDSPVAAGALGLARGATLGLSDVGLLGLGVDKELIRETRDRNRAASLTGEVVGDIGGAVLSGGAGTLGSIGRATVSGQLTRLGERVAGRAVQSPVARAAIGNAIEGTIAAPAQYLAEERLKENPNYSAEVLISQAGRGLLLGGAIGGSFAGAGKGLGALATKLDGASSPTKLEDVIDNVTAKEADAITEGATAASTAPKKKQSVRSVVPLDQRSKEAVLEKAGEFTRAIDDQSTYVRGARREIQDLAPNIPPAQAAELQIAEQALRDATAAARRQFREIGRAVNKGEMPSALADDQAAAVATLSRLDQARAALDERLAAARGGVPGAPTTPIPEGPAPTRLPEGFTRGPNVAKDAPVLTGVPESAAVNPDAVYVVPARDLSGRVVDTTAGAGIQAKRTESIGKAWQQGKDLDPVQAVVKRDGTIEIVDGRHRLAAAQEQGRDIAIRFDQAADDVPTVPATADNLAILRRSEVLDDGTRLDPVTGEVLDDPGWAILARDLDRVQRSLGGAETPDWVAQGLERRRLGAERETIYDAFGGGRTRGGAPRGTDRVNRFAGGPRPANLRGDIDLGDARRIDEAGDVLTDRAAITAASDEAGSKWLAKWGDQGKSPEAQRELSSLMFQMRRLNRGEIDIPTAQREIGDILAGKAPAFTPGQAPQGAEAAVPPPATPSPASAAPGRAAEEAIPPPRDPDAPASARPRMPDPADAVPDADAPPPSPLDAVSLVPPVPDKSAVKALGKNAADALALWETGQSLGLPLPSPGSLMGPLSPLFKLYAGFRAFRMAAGRAGLIRSTEATQAASKVTEARDRITKIARQVATAGSKGLGSQALQSAATRAAVRITAPEATEEIRAVQQLQGRPDRVHARAEAMTSAAPPEVQTAGRTVAERTLAYLAKAAPRSPWTGTPFADEWEPSPMELDRWREVRGALERPLDALEALAAGNYSPEAIDAVREVYPEVFGGFRQAVLEQVDEIVQNAPYSTRVVLGDALEVPLDGTQMPFYEQGIAQTQQAQAAAAAGQDGQPRGASYIPAQSAIAARAQTPQERRAAR